MWPFERRSPSEDLKRLRDLTTALSAANWNGGGHASLQKSFHALNDLIYRQIAYYDSERRRRLRWSGITRGLAASLGIAGVVIPLLSSAGSTTFYCLAPYGYPSLVAAAAIITANKMLGVTGGHVRFASTQLELEHITTKFNLKWAEWLSRNGTASQIQATNEQAFTLLNEFSEEAYEVILLETTAWGESVLEGLNEYYKSLRGRASADGKKS